MSVHRGRRVIRVGLTGGIGAGKSTAARELRDRGAHIVDADAIAREVLEPGTPGLAAVARAFGPRVLEADGSLDRAALAEIVFDDPSARSRLETLTLPLIAETAAERMERHGGARVAVYDVPLLAEGGMADLFDCVVVVEAPLEERLARLAGRGMSRSQALERMSHQAGDRERRAVADVVLSNDASPDDLAVAVGRLWRCLTAQ
ncbi:MAG: dephospho-CoA kinase [Actinomyces sp.]|nr:dephospho-CoA kinase [Actinomyces sp.]MDO4243884.1 dephospho-CoA kinase [Actinomyces sp.]